ncbi:MAG: hypothetical protein QNK89_01295 [Lacinutrix sp.]|uniref:hypothetical protein n=1 Tax=Lacinutrix sp. TaxID=1937692 RepID=UPI0030A043EF
MKTTKFYASAFLGLILLASCSSDDDSTPAPVEEEEAITSIVLTFTNQADATDTVVLTWDDANLDEVIDAGEKTVTGEFNTGEVYNASLDLFNIDRDFLEEDITSEQAGIDAHFFVYGATSVEFTMERADDDFTRSDNNKLGVNTVWAAGTTASTGDISIQLFHESPSVSDADGFGTAEGTDTDIDISFGVEIE